MLTQQLFESSPMDRGQDVLRQLMSVSRSGQDTDLRIGIEMMPLQSWQANYLMGLFKAIRDKHGVDKALEYIGNYDFVEHALARQEARLAQMNRASSVPGQRGVEENIVADIISHEIIKSLDEPNPKKQGMAEMDKSSPQPGRDGKVSHKTYGSRDNYKLGDPEATGKPAKTKDVAKQASKELEKAFKNTKEGMGEEKFGPAVTAAIQQGKSPSMVAYADSQDKLNIGKELKIRQQIDKGEDPTISAAANALRKASGVAEGSGNIEIGQQMANDGITYSPDRENEIIGQMAEYMKKSGMSPKQIRYLLSYDEDYISDQLGFLPRQGVAQESHSAGEPVTLPKWQMGLPVFVKHLGQKGEIASLAGDSAMVNVGMRQYRVPLAGLKRYPVDAKKKDLNETPYTGRTVVVYDARGNLLDKLDVNVAAQKYGVNPQDITAQLQSQEHTTIQGNRGPFIFGRPIAPISETQQEAYCDACDRVESQCICDNHAADHVEEDLRKWFKEKWVRFGPDGKIRGDCARGDDSEGKPKCLPQSKAHALGKKGRASAAAKKRRQDPNPERKGKAINVATKTREDVGEDKKQCPPATQDIELNLKNRQKAIDEYGYGPLNPALPNVKFWAKKVDEWNLDSAEEAKQSLCGNCAAFDITSEMLDCIAQGIGSEPGSDPHDTIEAGHLGYCKFLKFKCASERTCDAWVTGGPITDDKQVSEGLEQKMSVKDTLAYLQKVMGTASHEDWRNHIVNTNEYFVLKDVPVASLKSELSGLNKDNVEKYKQMDFSKAPPIVIGSDGNILDGYHRVNVAKALRVPTLKAWVGVKKQGVAEETCPDCGGPMFSELLQDAKKDACYYKVKSRYKVWPSAYASGALVQCRKKGAKNWGSKNEGVDEGSKGALWRVERTGSGHGVRYYVVKGYNKDAKAWTDQRGIGDFATQDRAQQKADELNGNHGVEENFDDGKKPGRKGLAKRMGVPTKASVSTLRKIAKNSSGEKQRMAHWMANMKAGRQKNEDQQEQEKSPMAHRLTQLQTLNQGLEEMLNNMRGRKPTVEASKKSVEPPEADYDDKYQAMVQRVGQKAREQEKRKPVDVKDLARRMAAVKLRDEK